MFGDKEALENNNKEPNFVMLLQVRKYVLNDTFILSDD